MTKKVFRVICSQAGGRRRGGRNWPAGETIVQPDDMSEETLAALKADGTFVVAEVDAAEAGDGAAGSVAIGN